MGSADVRCVVCGKAMSYDDAYTVVEHAGEACPVCCRDCMQRLREQPESHAK